MPHVNLKREAAVRNLYYLNLTYSEIASRLNLTRCTVAGIIHRGIAAGRIKQR